MKNILWRYFVLKRGTVTFKFDVTNNFCFFRCGFLKIGTQIEFMF